MLVVARLRLPIAGPFTEWLRQLHASACSQGLSSAVTNGTVLPTLHVVASITLASLMGGFNTQTYLDLSSM